MTARQQGNECLLDHLVLAEDHRPQPGFHLGEGLGSFEQAGGGILAVRQVQDVGVAHGAFWVLGLAGIARFVKIQSHVAPWPEGGQPRHHLD